MNKKIFATVLFAVAAFVSTSASAQNITYTNSVPDADYNQDATAVVGAGGGAIRANDLIISTTADDAIPEDAEIIVRLPAGLNFDGEPSYLVSPATPNEGMTLIDGTVFGDPTLDDPGITLNDTNGDGGMDRALVTVGAASLNGDELIISMNVTATEDAALGINKASLIVNNGLAVVQDVATVLSSLSEPVSSASGTALTAVDQTAATNVGVSTATAVITIPAGTANNTTITLKPQSKVQWATGGSNISYQVLSPLAAGTSIIAQASPLAVGAGTSTVTMTVVAPTTGGLTEDVQVRISVDAVDTLGGGTTGLRGLTVAGTAGISGNAQLLNVLPNGSSADLTSGAEPTNIVAGSTAPQTLPSIDIVENFVGDAASAGTPTITITANTGLTFGDTSTITVNGSTLGTATVSVNASMQSVLTLDMTPVLSPASKTLTITGIQATAASTASGNLSAKIGSPNAPDLFSAPSDTVVVAVAVPVGDVTVTGPATPATAGPGVTPPSATVTLTESTYGSITLANASQVEDAFFRVTPSSNASISDVAVVANFYGAGGAVGVPGADAPTFATCAMENGVTTGAWICEVTAESTALVAGTDTVSVTIGYSVDGDASIGSTVTATFDGNAGVSGTATLADIGVATSATKGIVPDLTPGETEAQDLATLTITENFAGAIQSGSFRLIAPTGVTFNNVTSVAATASPGTLSGTVTIADTFSPSDTLVIPINGTPTVSFTAQAVIGPNVSEWVSFNITDGDINGNNKTGITDESIMLAYADGTLEAIDAGDDVSVNVNFSATNTVEGGLPEYSATSSDSAVASVSISGDQLTITGKSAGSAIITVVDELGGPADTVSVDVTEGAAQPEAPKINVLGGGTTDATITGGASSDGGATFADEFTTADDVTLVATINVDPADQGADGEVYVIARSTPAGGGSHVWSQLNEDGQLVSLDPLDLGTLEAHIVATPLGDVYNITVYSGNLAAGTHRVAVGYAVDGGPIIYAGKAILIEVTEE